MNEVEWDIKKFMTFSLSSHMAHFFPSRLFCFYLFNHWDKSCSNFHDTLLFLFSFAAHAPLLTRNGAEIT